MERMAYIVDVEQTIKNLIKSKITLYIMTASSSYVITIFFFVTKLINPFKDPMSMYSMTCLTSPSRKKQV